MFYNVFMLLFLTNEWAGPGYPKLQKC